MQTDYKRELTFVELSFVELLNEFVAEAGSLPLLRLDTRSVKHFLPPDKGNFYCQVYTVDAKFSFFLRHDGVISEVNISDGVMPDQATMEKILTSARRFVNLKTISDNLTELFYSLMYQPLPMSQLCEIASNDDQMQTRLLSLLNAQAEPKFESYFHVCVKKLLSKDQSHGRALVFQLLAMGVDRYALDSACCTPLDYWPDAGDKETEVIMVVNAEKPRRIKQLQKIINEYKSRAQEIIVKGDVSEVALEQHRLNLQLLNGEIARYEKQVFANADSATLNWALLVRRFDIVDALIAQGVKPNQRTLAFACLRDTACMKKAISIGAKRTMLTLAYVKKYFDDGVAVLKGIEGAELKRTDTPKSITKTIIHDMLDAVQPLAEAYTAVVSERRNALDEAGMSAENNAVPERLSLTTKLIDILTSLSSSSLNSTLLRCYLDFKNVLDSQNHYEILGIDVEKHPNTVKEKLQKIASNDKQLSRIIHPDFIDRNNKISSKHQVNTATISDKEVQALEALECADRKSGVLKLDMKQLAKMMARAVLYAYRDAEDGKEVPGKKDVQQEMPQHHAAPSNSFFQRETNQSHSDDERPAEGAAFPPASEGKARAPELRTDVETREMQLLRHAIAEDAEEVIALLKAGVGFSVQAFKLCDEIVHEEQMTSLLDTICFSLDALSKDEWVVLSENMDSESLFYLYGIGKNLPIKECDRNTLLWLLLSFGYHHILSVVDELPALKFDRKTAGLLLQDGQYCLAKSTLEVISLFMKKNGRVRELLLTTFRSINVEVLALRDERPERCLITQGLIERNLRVLFEVYRSDPRRMLELSEIVSAKKFIPLVNEQKAPDYDTFLHHLVREYVSKAHLHFSKFSQASLHLFARLLKLKADPFLLNRYCHAAVDLSGKDGISKQFGLLTPPNISMLHRLIDRYIKSALGVLERSSSVKTPNELKHWVNLHLLTGKMACSEADILKWSDSNTLNWALLTRQFELVGKMLEYGIKPDKQTLMLASLHGMDCTKKAIEIGAKRASVSGRVLDFVKGPAISKYILENTESVSADSPKEVIKEIIKPMHSPR